MPIEFSKTQARITGTLTVEEAEGLFEWLQKHPRGKLDLSACDHVHCANLQLLMAAQPVITAMPTHAHLAAWLEAALNEPFRGNSNA
jgi:hypothetical protein